MHSLSASSGIITDIFHNGGCEYLVVCTFAVDIKVVKLVGLILTTLLDQQAHWAAVPVESIKRSRHIVDKLDS